MDFRHLFSELPPELREMIYAQTVTEDNHVTSAGLGFTSKVYDSSHTRVEITPVYYGNPALLALHRYRFLEGAEYSNWILNNAVQLRIHVLFKGHENTFIQEHWDKKMAAHLRNLVNRHPWLRMVTDYDVRILWKPASLATGRKKKSVGAIAKTMMEVLTQEVNADLMVKRGVVSAGLRVAGSVVCDSILRSRKLELGEFVWGVDSRRVKTQIREVGVALDDEERCGTDETHGYMPSRFKVVPKITTTKRLGEWEPQDKWTSVFRRDVRMNREEVCRAHGEGDGAFTERVHLAVLEEISGSRKSRSQTETAK